MTRLHTQITAAGFAATLLLAAGAVEAHGGVSSRSLVLQVDAHGVAGLWDVTERGQRVALLLAMFDLNRDGKLSSKEKAAVAASIVQRGMAGVSVAVEGRPLRSGDSLRARVVEGDGRKNSLEAVGLVTYSTPLTADSYAFEVSVGDGYGALGLQLQTLGSWRLAGAEFTKLAEDGRGLGAPQTIAPGGTLRFQIERGKTTPKPVQTVPGGRQ